MQILPRGPVTSLFTDIQDSTRLWHAHAGTMPAICERHDTILQAPPFAHGGVVEHDAGRFASGTHRQAEGA